jgi:hypothetical protein
MRSKLLTSVLAVSVMAALLATVPAPAGATTSTPGASVGTPSSIARDKVSIWHERPAAGVTPNADRLTLSTIVPDIGPNLTAGDGGLFLSVGERNLLGAIDPLVGARAVARFESGQCRRIDDKILLDCRTLNGDWAQVSFESPNRRADPAIIVRASVESILGCAPNRPERCSRPADPDDGVMPARPVVNIAIGDTLVQLSTSNCGRASKTRQDCSTRGTQPLPNGGALLDVVGPRSFMTAPATPQSIATPQSVTAQESSSGCGEVYQNVGETEMQISGTVSMVPVAGAFLGSMLKDKAYNNAINASNAADACIEGQIEIINEQLANLQSQISQLQLEAQQAAGIFYQSEFNQAQAIAGSYAQQYAASLATISPGSGTTEGLFGNFMLDVGFWEPGDVVASGFTIDDATTPTRFQSAVQAVNPGSQTQFQQAIANLSGTSLLSSKCPGGGCAKQVLQNPNSQLVGLFNSKAAALQAQWKMNVGAGTASGANVVTIYDDYNNALSDDYQSSLNSLQQGLTLEQLTNQMNFQYAFDNCSVTTSWSSCSQIASWGAIPGTSFSIANQPAGSTWNDAVIAYNTAQKQLFSVYKARTNRLASTTLQYLVSDVPFGPQSYPTGSLPVTIGSQQQSLGAVNYSKLIGAALPTVVGGPSQYPMLALPNAAGGTWQDDAALYQFGALFSAQQCAAAVLNNDGTELLSTVVADPGNCPVLFATDGLAALNDSYYDGDRLQPYYASPSGIVLTGAMQVNLRLCNPVSSMLTWYQPGASNINNAAGLTAGSWYLNCGNWATIGASGWTCFPNAHCPSAWQQSSSTWNWVSSQYSGDESDYPDYQSHNHTLNTKSSQVAVYVVSGPAPAGQWTNAPLEYFNSTSKIFFNYQLTCLCSANTYANYQLVSVYAPTKNNKTALISVMPVPVASQSTAGANTNSLAQGFFIPVAFTIQYSSSNTYTVGWQPMQNTTIATSGFTCDGWTCTVADGSVWNVANPSSILNIPASNSRTSIQMQQVN